MSTNHLAGPWGIDDTVSLEGRTGIYARITDGDGMAANILAHVCVAHVANHELQTHGWANAALIAAAPVMFEALEKIAQDDPSGHFGEIARAALSTATRSTHE